MTGLPASVLVGGCSRGELVRRLTEADIRLNEHAETLLADGVFDGVTEPYRIELSFLTVAELGFPEGARLDDCVAAARAVGLRRCAVEVAPYLRLAYLNQPSATDSDMHGGRAPSGSVTVASPPLRADDSYPKGFYLRVVDGIAWLRGYRCDADFRFSPGDRFVFAC